MSYVGYILAAILLLLLMITVHEFGHYIAGKIFGFGIEEFAIGFGPKLYRKQRKTASIFPSGFCRSGDSAPSRGRMKTTPIPVRSTTGNPGSGSSCSLRGR